MLPHAVTNPSALTANPWLDPAAMATTFVRSCGQFVPGAEPHKTSELPRQQTVHSAASAATKMIVLIE